MKPTVFDKFLFNGDVFEVDGHRFRVNIEPDNDANTPWNREDGHGPVSEWTNRNKRPGERLLAKDRGERRFYDFAEAVKIAKRDRWGAPDGFFQPDYIPTMGEVAVAAANADFARLEAYCMETWIYVGVCVTMIDENDQAITGEYDFALWGIESDCVDYITETAHDLAKQIIDSKVGKAKKTTGEITDEQAMSEIQALLSAERWQVETIEYVADIVRRTGRNIDEPSEGEDDE